MPQSGRDIKRRIKSVGNTRKITKAMEMVSAAKMRRAVSKVLATRSYADLSWQTVLHLASKVGAKGHPFFYEKKKVENVGIIVISTNRGLCGSFNLNLVDKIVETIGDYYSDLKNKEVISCGVRGRDEIRRRGLNLTADFPKADITGDSLEIRPIARMVIKNFLEGKYDKVFIAYTDYQSALKQTPKIIQLLPFPRIVDSQLGYTSRQQEKKDDDFFQTGNFSDFLFEPSRREVLDAFLPRLVEVMIYQAVLESEASEHSARMMAMKNASEAAEDMMADLTLVYNKARQAGITREIAEISGGAAALE